ncbi:MAG: hypothetical protein WDN46_21150 [Methylocella sp.]
MQTKYVARLWPGAGRVHRRLDGFVKIEAANSHVGKPTWALADCA